MITFLPVMTVSFMEFFFEIIPEIYL